MRRTWVATALFLVLAVAVPAAAAPKIVQPAMVTVDVMSALREAAKAPQAKFTTLQTGKYVAVYNEGGKKFAVIDQTVAGAPQGAPVVDGVVMEQLGLDYIDFLQFDSMVKDDGAGKNAAADNAKAEPVAGRDSIGAQAYYKDWEGPWQWESDWGTSRVREQSDGEVSFGCENATGETIVVDCELTTEASFTTNGIFNLTLLQMLQLGFNIGRTDRKSIKMTVRTIPPNSLYYLTPMTQRYSRYFYEIQRHYQCERPALGWWCISGTTREIHSHEGQGQAHKSELLYGRLLRDHT